MPKPQVVEVSPDRARDAIRKGLSMGADRAILVTDDSLAGADALLTARVLGPAPVWRPARALVSEPEPALPFGREAGAAPRGPWSRLEAQIFPQGREAKRAARGEADAQERGPWGLAGPVVARRQAAGSWSPAAESAIPAF